MAETGSRPVAASAGGSGWELTGSASLWGGDVLGPTEGSAAQGCERTECSEHELQDGEFYIMWISCQQDSGHLDDTARASLLHRPGQTCGLKASKALISPKQLGMKVKKSPSKASAGRKVSQVPYLTLGRGVASSSARVGGSVGSPGALAIVLRGVHVGQILGGELLIPGDAPPFEVRVGSHYPELKVGSQCTRFSQ